MNRPYWSPHDRHIPIVTRWGGYKPNQQADYSQPVHSGVLGKLGHHPRILFRPGGSVAGQLLGWRSIRWCCRHHRFILSLCHLVLAQVKAFRVRDTLCSFSRSASLPASVVGLPIVKVPGGHQIISIATVAFRSTERAPVTVTVRVVVAVLPPPSCTV